MCVEDVEVCRFRKGYNVRLGSHAPIDLHNVAADILFLPTGPTDGARKSRHETANIAQPVDYGPCTEMSTWRCWLLLLLFSLCLFVWVVVVLVVPVSLFV